jgi:2-dehydropantoate 2-reductase
VRLEEAAIDRALELVDSLPESGTSSLHRDIAAGRPSELEAWNGAVVRLGRESGVATPAHEEIYALLLPRERRARASR